MRESISNSLLNLLLIPGGFRSDGESSAGSCQFVCKSLGVRHVTVVMVRNQLRDRFPSPRAFDSGSLAAYRRNAFYGQAIGPSVGIPQKEKNRGIPDPNDGVAPGHSGSCSKHPENRVDSKPAPPTILPGNPDQVVVVVGPCRHAAAHVKLDRIVEVYGKRQRAANPPVLLQVVALLTVDCRAATGKVGGIERPPNAGAETVYCMPLHGVDRILRTGVTAVEILVVGEEGCRSLELERPRPHGLGNA